MSLGKATPEQYQEQLKVKVEKTKQEFAHFSPPELEVFESPDIHFRMRAEFKIWHEKGQAYYAMYKPGEYKKPVKIDEFSIGSTRICELMPKLLEEVNANDELKRKLFQVEFLTTTTGDSVTTLIYHKALGEEWNLAAQALQSKIGTKIIGRSRKQKVVLDRDWVEEVFQVDHREYTYQQVETGFTQPNAFVCRAMLNWAVTVSKNLNGDLVELYCGNANFTLPLSRNFGKVLATEISKTSVNSALTNIKKNQCNNITIARMSSEEFTQALNKEREFRRLKDIDLESYDFSSIFVDPPRAGLDSETEKLCAQFENIIYISCNPETLKNNLETLCKTHEIKKFALFDQFPYTEHRESGVLLVRKTKPEN